jgi:hypothetical protein
MGVIRLVQNIGDSSVKPEAAKSQTGGFARSFSRACAAGIAAAIRSTDPITSQEAVSARRLSTIGRKPKPIANPSMAKCKSQRMIVALN